MFANPNENIGFRSSLLRRRSLKSAADIASLQTEDESFFKNGNQLARSKKLKFKLAQRLRRDCRRKGSEKAEA